MRMQELVRTASSCHTEVLFVELLDRGIVMRFPDEVVSVLLIKTLGSFLSYIYPVSYIGKLQRLTASVDTSSGTCHDLYEMEFLTGFYGLHELSGVAETVGYGSSHVEVAYFQIGNLYAFKSSDILVPPPVAPKMAPAPEAFPNGLSKSESPRSGKSMPVSYII